MKNFIVKGKNGIRSSWEDLKSFDAVEKAIQYCEQYNNSNRGKIGTEYYKTKVVNTDNIKVYP